jgi:hypothetical protein
MTGVQLTAFGINAGRSLSTFGLPVLRKITREFIQDNQFLDRQMKHVLRKT